jgi:DNA-binding HxlR family transcriptional regulator
VGKIGSKVTPRSGCPVAISLDTIGDRWSLLIIRDMMVRGYRSFKQFQESGEGIATNILADRLQKLMAAGIIGAEVDEIDARRLNYRLTDKGIELAPMLLELLIWGARHNVTGFSNAWIEQVAQRRHEFLLEVRRRWENNDSTPLIPKQTPDSKHATSPAADENLVTTSVNRKQGNGNQRKPAKAHYDTGRSKSRFTGIDSKAKSRKAKN